MAREYPLSFAVRSGNVEVGILGDTIVVRRISLLAQLFEELGIVGLQRWLRGEQRLPLAVATAQYTGGVLRIYRMGQPWWVLEGVSEHYVAIDFAAEVRRFRA